jgi:3-oxoacyl-[acyl-carrier protein] reductase
MSTKLIGKVALMAGGSGGIGAAIAKRLAAEGAGVAITYVNGKQKADKAVDAIKRAGGNAIAIRGHSGDPKAVAAAVEETARTLTRLETSSSITPASL